MSTQPDRAFEVFVKSALSTIQKESWGRSKECKELREMCQNVLNLLHDHEQGHLQYDGSLAVAVLEPLYLACASSNPKIVDSALGCLHKLVAHAWLQGESSSGGQANDADVVSRVIRTVIRCAESSAAEGMQLAVIRALLTFTTAEHFVAHGDCLLAAVRMVFNLALGADDDIIKRTASNALLQMLNTITKRATAYQFFGSSSAATSRRSSLDGANISHSHSQAASLAAAVANAQAAGAGTGGAAPPPPPSRHQAGRIAEEQQATEAALAAAAAAAAARWVASGQPQAGAPPGPPSPLPGDRSTLESRAPSGALLAGPLSPSQSGALSEGPFIRRDASGASVAALAGPASAGGGAGDGGSGRPGEEGDRPGGPDSSRTAQLAILAEQRDLVGLEAALGAATSLDEGLSVSEEEGPVVGHVRHPRPSVGGLTPRPAQRSGAGEGAAVTGTSAGGGAGAGSTGSGAVGSVHSTGPTFSLRTSTASVAGLPHGFSQPSPPPPLPSPKGASGGDAGGLLGPPPGLWSPATPSASGPSLVSASSTRDPGTQGPEEQPGAQTDQGVRPADSHFLTTGGTSAAAAAGGLRSGQSSQHHLGHHQSFHSQHSHHSHHHHHHHHRHSGAGAGRGPGPLAKPMRTTERDVLLVLTAFCRLASREAGVTDIDKYLAAGKLLALELVVKVLQNPIHCWDNVRDEFVRHLHQPLCLVMLRNCSPSEPAAFQLALRLLTAVLVQPKLRKGLKAELGAFYPLLLLRPLEVEVVGPAELAPIAAAVPCLVALCGEHQLLVDLFVNYDCDLKAPNLYERTVQALSRLSRRTELEGPPPAPAPKQQELARQLASVRDAALRCLLSVVHCLDVWSAPLKESGPAERPAGTDTSGTQKQLGPGVAALPEDGDAANGFAARANGGGSGGASEAERFEAAKVTKSSLSRGLSMFNGGSPVKAIRFLISSGVVEDSPAGAAVFLRAHSSDLDPSAMGEYLGHHEDFELAAMHAYVDQERYLGMTIDAALRAFLQPFRLPGEAQKIDRLMEAFAERYVRDNPGLFRNADAAYVLAFAIIMLNTDAHNPLAERRLDRTSFVAMTSLPADDGGGGGSTASVYEPALPVRELEGIYDRILAQEIVVRVVPPGAAGGKGANGNGAGGKGGRGGGGNKLAAALGLRALVAPFRAPADRKQVSDAERQRQQLMEVAELALARGGGGGGDGVSSLITTWHACTHAAHTRPMLTVSGEALTTALVAAVQRAADATAAEAVLTGLVTLAQLAGVVGLEELCEVAVTAVAEVAGVAAPAPFGTAAAGRQLVALRALLGAVSSPDAGQLGSAWTIILRAASELEALVRVVTRPVQPGESGVAFMSPPSAAAGGGGADAVAKAAASGGSLLSKMFGGLWGGGGGGSGNSGVISSASVALNNGSSRGGSAARKDSGGGPQGLPPPPVRVMPGAAMVMWAVTDGRQVVEQVYSRSASLDGEAVVVFVRALCAVSREELDAQQPRVYSLQRLVEVAHLNLAGRIRLIWSKLWAVLSAHLVMAACHGQQPIAAQAVDALRGIAARVLEREQQQLQRAGVAAAAAAAGAGPAGADGGQPLTHSTWGSSEGALRPFVAVLRLSDDAGVRAMALAAVVSMMTAHARSLGAGWRVAMEALRCAADDVSPAVYEQAVGALEVAVAALYRAAAIAPVSPAPTVKHAAAAPAVVAALAAAPPGHDCYRETLRAVLTAVRNPHQPDRVPAAVQLLVQVGERLALRTPPVHSAMPRAGGGGGTGSLVPAGALPYSPLNQAYRGPAQPHLVSHDSNGPLSPPRGAYRSMLDQLAGGHQHPPSSHAEDWSLLLEVVAEVAATPATPRVAAAGLEAALDLMRTHSAAWGRGAWQVMLQRVVSAVAFRVPPALNPAGHPAEAAAAAAAGLPLESIAASFVARVDRLFPLMCAQLAPLAAAAAAREAASGNRRRRYSYDSDADDDEDEVYGRAGGRGKADLHQELLQLLAETCLTWFRHTAEPVARVGLSSLSQLLVVTAGVVRPLPKPAEAAAEAGTTYEAAFHPHRHAHPHPHAHLRPEAQPQHRGWQVLLPLLSTALDSEMALVTAFVERLRQQQQRDQEQQQPLGPPGSAAGGLTPRGSAGGAAGAATASTAAVAGAAVADREVRWMRCRCRMLVLLQRALADFTSRRAEGLPWSVTRQFVGLLVGVARRLMAFNMREELPPAFLVSEQQRPPSQSGAAGGPASAVAGEEGVQGLAKKESAAGLSASSSGALLAAPGAGAAAGEKGSAAGSKAPAAGDGWGDAEGWGDGWDEEAEDAGEERRAAVAGDTEASEAVNGPDRDGRAGSRTSRSSGNTGAEATDSTNPRASRTGSDKPQQPQDQDDPELVVQAAEASASSVEGGGTGAVEVAAVVEPEVMEPVAAAVSTSGADGSKSGGGSPSPGGNVSGPALAPTATGSSSSSPPTAANGEAAAPAASSGEGVGGVGLAAGARLRLSGAHLQLTSATSHDSLRPALARLEVEGADAAMTVLLLCCAPPASHLEAEATTAGTAVAERRREALELLDSLCRFIVRSNVAALTAAATATLHPHPHPHAALPSMPLEPSALDPALPGSSWDHAVRAVVLARAIRVLLHGVSTEPLGEGAAAAAADDGARGQWHAAQVAGRRLALLPDMLVLLGSHQPVVRAAVAEFLDEVMGPRVLRISEAAQEQWKTHSQQHRD